MVNIRSPCQLFPLHTVEVEIVRVHPEYLCMPGGGVVRKLHCIVLHSDMATDDISIVTGDHQPVRVMLCQRAETIAEKIWCSPFVESLPLWDGKSWRWLGRRWDKKSWKWLPPACIRVAFKVLHGLFLFFFPPSCPGTTVWPDCDTLTWCPSGLSGWRFFGSWAFHKMPARRTSRKPTTIWPSSGTRTRRRKEKGRGHGKI